VRWNVLSAVILLIIASCGAGDSSGGDNLTQELDNVFDSGITKQLFSNEPYDISSETRARFLQWCRWDVVDDDPDGEYEDVGQPDAFCTCVLELARRSISSEPDLLHYAETQERRAAELAGAPGNPAYAPLPFEQGFVRLLRMPHLMSSTRLVGETTCVIGGRAGRRNPDFNAMPGEDSL